MKPIPILATLLTLLCACGPSGNSYRIDGQLKGMKEGEIYVVSPTGQPDRIDTIRIRDERFTYAGSTPQPALLQIILPNAFQQTLVVEPGASLTYHSITTDLAAYTVEGSRENELLNQFRTDTRHLDATARNKQAAAFIRKHPESQAAIAVFMQQYIYQPSSDSSLTRQLLRLLLRQHPDDRLLLFSQGALQNQRTASVGQTIPYVTLTDKQKRPIPSIDITAPADHTLIAFWATWARSHWDFMNQLRKLRDTYVADHRLRILAISLDARIFEWEQFIDADSTGMHHICDGQAFASPLADQLAIRQVPFFLLTDRKGRILLTGTTPEQLRTEVPKHL